jgi:hypothetical protein
MGLLSVTVAGGELAGKPGRVQAKVWTCADGAHPCKSGNVTQCCRPGQYCCNRKTGNPICLDSKKECPA